MNMGDKVNIKYEYENEGQYLIAQYKEQLAGRSSLILMRFQWMQSRFLKGFWSMTDEFRIRWQYCFSDINSL